MRSERREGGREAVGGLQRHPFPCQCQGNAGANTTCYRATGRHTSVDLVIASPSSSCPGENKFTLLYLICPSITLQVSGWKGEPEFVELFVVRAATTARRACVGNKPKLPASHVQGRCFCCTRCILYIKWEAVILSALLAGWEDYLVSCIWKGNKHLVRVRRIWHTGVYILIVPGGRQELDRVTGPACPTSWLPSRVQRACTCSVKSSVGNPPVFEVDIIPTKKELHYCEGDVFFGSYLYWDMCVLK